MSTLRNSTRFSCFDDCRQSGCPSHEMTISIQNTSDVLIAEIDGKRWFGADPSEWTTLKKLLEETNYYNFNLDKPM